MKEAIGFYGNKRSLQSILNKVIFRYERTTNARNFPMEQTDTDDARAAIVRKMDLTKQTGSDCFCYLEEKWFNQNHTRENCWKMRYGSCGVRFQFGKGRQLNCTPCCLSRHTRLPREKINLFALYRKPRQITRMKLLQRHLKLFWRTVSRQHLSWIFYYNAQRLLSTQFCWINLRVHKHEESWHNEMVTYAAETCHIYSFTNASVISVVG
jgi:hypothetical protein